MDTPFALIVFVIIAVVVALIVYFSRRRSSDEVSRRLGEYGGANPPATWKPSEEDGYQSAPEQQDFGTVTRPRAEPPPLPTGGARPSSPADKDKTGQHGAVPPPPPSAQPAIPAAPAPAQPAPTPPKRSGRGLFEDEEQVRDEAPASSGADRDKDEEKKTAKPPVMPAPQPEPIPAKPAVPSPAPAEEIPDWLGSLPDLDDIVTAAPGGLPEAKPDAPAIPVEDVRFTAYHPKEASVEAWYTLLVYAHIEAALSKVQADAAKFKDQMGDIPREARSTAGAQLARGTELTIVPEMDNVEFNPQRTTFKWVEDMHRAEFRMKGAKELAGLAGNGTISIFVGPLIVATIRFGMLFNEKPAAEAIVAPLSTSGTMKAPMESTTATLYKADQIFVSYSHKDTPVVLACRDAYKALGYDVLIDIDNLRSGEKWNDALMRMIDRADIFQLFWSKNSAESKYCRQEWEYALRKGKERFVRPVYWEQPLVPPPDELDELHFAYVPLPKKDQ